MKHTFLIFGLLWALGASGQIYIDSYRFGGGAPPATLLLDDYPNAAAAYSLRKLRTAYTGNCVQVRRQSDGTTSNIGFLGNYLDTAALKTFCASTNCFVRTWYDQSTFGRNVAQTTDSRQPQIVSSGALMYNNGTPAIYFNSALENFLERGASIGTVSAPVSTFSVSTFEAGNAGAYLYDQGIQDFILTLVSFQERAFNGVNLFGNNIVNNVKLIHYVLFNTTSSNLISNTTSFSGSTGTRTGGENIVLGVTTTAIAATIFKGYYFEFITYHSDQSANQANIRANINSFYNAY